MCKRRMCGLFFLLVFVAVMFSCCKRDTSIVDAEDYESLNTIKIGVFEPLSSDVLGGRQELLGIEYANSIKPIVRIDGQFYRVVLEVVDSGLSSDTVYSGAEKLSKKGVSLILGAHGYTESALGAEVFRNKKIPAIAISATNSSLIANNPYYYGVCYNNDFQGRILANYAWQSGFRRVYCLFEVEDEYSEGVVNYFSKAFKEKGGEVVEEQFNGDCFDCDKYISVAKENECDSFLLPIKQKYAATFIKNADEKGLEIPIFSGDSWDSGQILISAMEKNLKIFISTYYEEGKEPEFERAFSEWMSKDRERIEMNGETNIIAASSIMGYDAYMVALEAIRLADSNDSEKIQTVMHTVSYKKGILGPIEFNEVGNAVRTEAVIKKCNTKKGVWEYVGKQTAY